MLEKIFINDRLNRKEYIVALLLLFIMTIGVVVLSTLALRWLEMVILI